MKNIQHIYKRALWGCIILLLVKPLPVYTASAYKESVSTSQALVKKMVEGQQLTSLEVDKRALLKKKILGHIGNHDADFSPSSQSAAQILSRMSLEAAFDSIKTKGTITPAITEYLRAYSSVIHRSEKFDRQEFRGLDDYDMWGNSSASIPEEAPIYSSSVNMHNKDAWRCISFLGEEEKLVIGFEARLLKESVLLSSLVEDRETSVLTINKTLTQITLKELYFVLETVANSTKESLDQYLALKNEGELIKIANTAHYLEIHKLYEDVTDHVARIIAEDSTPATSFTQMFFDSGTSLTGSMKKNVQEELQDILPKNIIDDIVRKIGFKFSKKSNVKRERRHSSSGNLSEAIKDTISPDATFRIDCDKNNFELTSVYSNGDQKLIHTLDWFQKSSNDVVNTAWSPNNKQFSLGSSNGKIGIFQIDTWDRIQTLVGHTDYVSKTTWSLDGLFLASASHDGTIRIWNTVTGNLLHTLKTDAVAIHFAPNGKYLASAIKGGTVHIWNVSTGKLVHTLVFEHSSIGVESEWEPNRYLSMGVAIQWLPDSLKIFSKVGSTYISTYYRQSYPDFISEGDPTIEINKSFWTEIHSFESETLEQKQERVYRFIERAAQADAKQGKSTSSSCVIN